MIRMWEFCTEFGTPPPRVILPESLARRCPVTQSCRERTQGWSPEDDLFDAPSPPGLIQNIGNNG